VTPETRAARDRLARFAAADFPMPALRPIPEITHLTQAEAAHLVDQVMRGIQETLAPDLHIVLAALDNALPGRYDRQPVAIVVSDAEEWNCEDCMCCSRERCHPGEDSGCPSNSLGESICPCTED
jgi:hypothetical protein